MLDHDDEIHDVFGWLAGRGPSHESLDDSGARALSAWIDTGSPDAADSGELLGAHEAITHTRRNLVDLTSAQHVRLRSAYAALNTSSNKSWGRFVFIHRVVGSIVHSHAEQRFLPWHRLMVWKFEQLLRRTSEGAGVFVPYWTWWQDTRTGRKGLPPLWADFRPNVLFPDLGDTEFLRTIGSLVGSDVRTALGVSLAEMINVVVASVLDDSGNSILGTSLPVTRIARSTLLGGTRSAVGRELPDRAAVRGALGRTTFADMTRALESVHGRPHMWIGDNGRADGRMADVEMSPCDPLFYFHHAEVDRLWHLWQVRTGTRATWTMTGAQMPPWSETLAQTMDISAAPLEFAYENRTLDDPFATP
jgi:tyrosinase